MGSFRAHRVAYCLERLGWAGSGAAGVAMHYRGVWSALFYIGVSLMLGAVAKYLRMERGFFG